MPRKCLRLITHVTVGLSVVFHLTLLTHAESAATTGQNEAGPVELSAIDRTFAPGDDFFRYANGMRLKANSIPADRSSWGIGEILEELTDERLAELIQSAAANYGEQSDTQRVVKFYLAFLDESRIESLGLQPAQPILDRIAAIASRKTLSEFLGASLRTDVDLLNDVKLHSDNLFGLWIAPDLDHPTRVVPFLMQGGLGLPDRHYYLEGSPRAAEIRRRYREHISRLFALAGFDRVEARTARVVGLETRIARLHQRLADMELAKLNNRWAASVFSLRAPGIDWRALFIAAGLARQPSFIVCQPPVMIGTAALVRTVPLETWKDWLRFHYLDHVAPRLPRAFAEEHFSFHSRVLSGAKQMPPRWKRAIEQTNQALGEAVGKLYVDRYFSPGEKARATVMVQNLVETFSQHIGGLEWMAPATRERARAKLSTLKIGVGYPDHWRSFVGLDVRDDDAFGNVERAERFELEYNISKLKSPVDRSEWAMLPQRIDAVSLPALNAIDIPAGILQPPFFDSHRPVAMDYGAAGSVIGHEISHIFDDQGALFDSGGRLRKWWTSADLAGFRASGARLIAQFNGYRPFADTHVDGTQTFNENLADLVGLRAAYDAWHATLNDTSLPDIEGFNGEQLFFIGYAQSWQEIQTESLLRKQLTESEHAPAEYRVDTVRNLNEWYSGFQVNSAARLYLAPRDRVRPW